MQAVAIGAVAGGPRRLPVAPPRRLRMAGNAATPRRWPNHPVKTMRAEIVTLVEEIKQSVGLLRRHL
jgi:hypothetical protein